MISPRSVRILFPLSIGLNVAFFLLLGLMIFSPQLLISLGARHWGREGFREKMIRTRAEKIWKELEVTPEQKAALDPLLDRALAAVRDSSDQMRVAEGELFRHVLRHPEDQPGIEARRDRLDETILSTGHRFVSLLRESVPVLTPQQIDRLETMIVRDREARAEADPS